jgi:hypothetical protein
MEKNNMSMAIFLLTQPKVFCVKRTIKGTYHNNTSNKYAQGYMDEIAFRYNTRKYSTEERFDLMLSSTIGKRLTYKQLTSTF